MSLGRKKLEYEAVWPSLRVDIERLLEHRDMQKLSFGQMYTQVYDLCNAMPDDFTEKLFIDIQGLIKRHVETVLLSIVRNEDKITCYSLEWKRYNQAINWLNHVCNFLNVEIFHDKYAIPDPHAPHQQVPRMTIEALGFYLWKEAVVVELKQAHGNCLVEAILAEIQRDRAGNTFSSDAIKTATQSFLTINRYSLEQPRQIYSEEFEEPFLENTRVFYREVGTRDIEELTVDAYMRRTNLRLNEESLRCLRFCDESTKDKLLKEFERELIANFVDKIQQAMVVYIKEEKVDDMGLAYDFLKRLRDGIQPILSCFESHVVEQGRLKLQEDKAVVLKDPLAYVDILIELHKKFTGVVKSAFRGDIQFEAACDKSFRILLNDSKMFKLSSSEMLAKSIDLVTRKGGKAKTEAELDGYFESIVTLFKYVDDKDIFQEYHSRLFAKRLINKNFTEQHEANLLNRLKTSCGLEFVSKLQRMFMDISLSAELSQKYKEMVPTSDIYIHVLTAGSWPFQQNSNTELILPDRFAKGIGDFSKFYMTQHNGRKLSWMNNLARADVRLNGYDKRYEANISLFQATCLLHFNDTKQLSVKQLADLTKLSYDEIGKIMNPLVEIGLFVEDNELYTINENFSSKRLRFKVSSASTQQQEEKESDSSRKAVEEDRRLFVQAAIVRIMKARKELGHNDLIQEVIQASTSRFHPSVQMIKKCIEQLMDKQYIERTSTDKYAYLA